MPAAPEPTPEVARARRYAAQVRIVLALAGGMLLVLDPGMVEHASAAALGVAVIGATGVVEMFVRDERWLRWEETLSCIAALTILGFGEGEVTPITLLWMVAAAVGVLARGGRVGWLGRVLVLAALLSPLITRGELSAEAAGLAIGAVALLLATGRVSRETAELLRRARHEADHDALTGALSRDAFRIAVDRRCAAGGDGAALVVVDLDDFGAVNKRHGHAAGDALLVAVAEAMAAVLGDDGVLGRIGGDEFAAAVDTADAETVAERLVAACAAAGQRTTACAGVARCPRDGDDAENLLAAADVALRVAKRRGGDGVASYEGAPLFAAGRGGAREALGRMCAGDGLTMAVQPIVAAASGAVHAYEALARFASHGREGPLHWFALADELGLRDELELACLDAALRLLGDLPGDARLSVNLSAPLLVDPRAEARIAAAPNVSRLIVEVTEESLARDGAEVAATIAALRGRGVEFAFDDIGAGYAGLGQLATLRPSYLKLDRGLVAGVDGEPDRLALLRALADYARTTDGLLVAEGVETGAELAAVRSVGVPLVQGYLFARPGPPWPSVAAAARLADFAECQAIA